MFTKIRRFSNHFFSKSRTINNEPLNKVSLIVIILVDIFILINVFIGLNDISHWHISPTEAYPCYAEWENYQTETAKTKDYDFIRLALSSNDFDQASFQQTYQRSESGHLGKVSEICLKYATIKDKLKNAEKQQTINAIDQKQTQISSLEQKNRDIRAQYDSTLLEKIAGQSREQSINPVGAEKAKQELDRNAQKLSQLKDEVSNLENTLIQKPESKEFLTLLQYGESFSKIEKGYQQASFWYPSIQFGFQTLFLLPLILVAVSIHNVAQRQGYGLVALISWHLLAIFFIPLILKVFEFLQFGVLFQWLFDLVSVLLGGLLFLISYLYILLVPLIGFGIIKFFQKVVFNPKLQVAGRVQKSLCIRCARKITRHDTHCPHCGYGQYVECPNCDDRTYKALPYCSQCGHPQGSERSGSVGRG